ncbi:MAG: bifunctional riboflavin kinase/FAD synthetase [Saprospiraceae bacterium]
MRIHKDINNLPVFKQAVITIGSFDGVHLGHKKLINKVNRLAKSTGGESVLITFDPHPRQIVFPGDDFQLLSTIEEKIILLEKLEVDHLVIVPFTVTFAQLSADEYIEMFLVKLFKPRYIVIGYDHRFGLSRQGDIHFLKWHGAKFGYEVIDIEKQEIEEIAISSTKIRRALLQGDIKQANLLAQDHYILSGEVVHGDKMGKKLGFPTANLQISDKHKLIPSDGIYAVWVHIDKIQYEGMLYIGHRPSIDSKRSLRIEVNIFDFDKDIYGKKISILLVEFLRSDQQLDTLDKLSKIISEDKIHAKAVLAQANKIEPKKINPEIAIVILNFNGREWLAKFLPDVIKYKLDHAKIIIADNFSTDDSVAFLNTNFSNDIEIITLPENTGYAGGYNEALKTIQADYFLLLNSDVSVTENWMTPLLEVMEADYNVAICQPKILSFNEPTKFEYAGGAGGWLDILGYPFCKGRILGHIENDLGQYDYPSEIFWASGAAFMIRAPLFKAIGGFDASYFAHMEEIDLCWRVKRAGFKVMVVPDAIIYHVGGGTLDYDSPKKVYLNFRNSLYTLMKNEPITHLLWKIPARFILDGFAAILYLVTKDRHFVMSILKAHLSFYKNFRRVLQKRAEGNSLVRALRTKERNTVVGRYSKLIVLDYYLFNKKTFKEIIQNENEH